MKENLDCFVCFKSPLNIFRTTSRYSLLMILRILKTNWRNFTLLLNRDNANSDFLWNYGFILLNDLELWHSKQPVMASLSKWIYIYNGIKNSNLLDNDVLPDDSLVLSICILPMITVILLRLWLCYFITEIILLLMNWKILLKTKQCHNIPT